ncbi:MAG: hypothetical protein IJ779_01200 [Ruminococcus sp.]|nr:hypothetical protein [Ruminococcus sp.]
MIRLIFHDYGCGDLDIEHELGITEDVIDFLLKNLPALDFEGTDNVCDLDDNLILWFSAKDEEKCVQELNDLLKMCVPSQTKMQYSVKITSDHSWY